MKKRMMGIAAVLAATLVAPLSNTYASPVDTATVVVNGHVIDRPATVVASDGSQPTTYMPIWYIGKALEAAGFSQSWDGSTHTWTLSTSTDGDFSTIKVGTGTASIIINGRLVKRINSIARRDPLGGKTAQLTTYMPIYYLKEIFHAAGIPSTWDGHSWTIQTQSTNPVVFGFVTDYAGNPASLNDLKQHPQVTEFSTFTHSITKNGSLSGALFTQAGDYAMASGDTAYVSVTNVNSSDVFDAHLAESVLNDTTARQTLINNLASLVKNTPFTGVNVDFEMLPASDRTAYSNFLTALAQRLHQEGKKLSVDAMAVRSSQSAYDYQAIGNVSDEVVLMTYDYSYPGGPAGPLAPVPWVKQVLSYAVSQIPPSKIILGLPAYGYDWWSGQTKALSLPSIDDLIAKDSITPQWDSTDDAPFFTYTEDGVTHTVYYEDGQSIRAKLALAKQFQVHGVSIWHMDLENQSVWQCLVPYVNGQ